jgi:predicted enzyme related to lactoylglutathione lyase
MPQDLKINYLELPGDNFAALQAFYESVFDWQFTEYGPDYQAFTDGVLDGGFYKSALQSRVATGGTLVVLYASDLRVVLDNVEHAGGKITRDIFDFPGGFRFHFNDPHGNELAVWSDSAPRVP